MKALVIDGSFGIENLKLVERAVPEPGPGQVLVRMSAASLNYRDLLMVKGAYNPRQPLPLIPCSDGVGRVEALGAGVDRVVEGQRVATCFCQGWISGEAKKERLSGTLGGPLDGTLAQYMVLDQQGVVDLPEHLSDEEAATLPCAALTAWTALVVQGGVKPGDWVLLQGTGGVSIFALQFAVRLGARVIITSSSDEKLSRARELGADHTINYVQQPDWGKAARKLTDGAGVDHVVEVGGAGTLAQSLKAVAVVGQISLIGVLSGVSAKLNLLPLLMQCVRVQGILVGHRDGFEAMNRAVDRWGCKPVVDRVFSLEETPQALEHMAAGAHLGKICIKID